MYFFKKSKLLGNCSLEAKERFPSAFLKVIRKEEYNIELASSPTKG